MADVTHNGQGRVFTQNRRDDGSSSQETYYSNGGKPVKTGGRLSETMRLIQERAGDRSYRVDDNQQRHNLDLLLRDISDVVDDIPKDVGLFDFNVTDGNPPRLWVDKNTYVVMANNQEIYRLLKDTRVGRVLVRESHDRRTIGEAVLHYVAERLTQYDQEQRKTNSDVFHSDPPSNRREDHQPDYAAPVMAPAPKVIVKRSPWRSFLWFMVGLFSGAALLFTYAWFRVEISAYLEKLVSSV